MWGVVLDIDYIGNYLNVVLFFGVYVLVEKVDGNILWVSVIVIVLNVKKEMVGDDSV